MSLFMVVVIIGVATLAGVVLTGASMRARRQKRLSGVDAMIGARAITLTALTPQGRVTYGGENWAATLEPPLTHIEEGTSVRITAVEGLRLRVQPVFTLKNAVE